MEYEYKWVSLTIMVVAISISGGICYSRSIRTLEEKRIDAYEGCVANMSTNKDDCRALAWGIIPPEHSPIE